jgi:hypothetical protein
VSLHPFRNRKSRHIRSCRFFAGTFIVERTVKFLGTFYLASTKPSFLPACPLISRLSALIRRPGGTPSDICDTGHSASQARLAVLLLSSLIHSTYFIILGSKSGFPSALVAYAAAAFARSFFTCTRLTRLRSSPSLIGSDLTAIMRVSASFHGVASSDP